MDRNMEPGTMVTVDEGVGNTDYDLVEWGGLEARVVSVEGDAVTVERDGKTQKFHVKELSPSVPGWVHGKKGYGYK